MVMEMGSWIIIPLRPSLEVSSTIKLPLTHPLRYILTCSTMFTPLNQWRTFLGLTCKGLVSVVSCGQLRWTLTLSHQMQICVRTCFTVLSWFLRYRGLTTLLDQHFAISLRSPVSHPRTIVDGSKFDRHSRITISSIRSSLLEPP